MKNLAITFRKVERYFHDILQALEKLEHSEMKAFANAV